MSFRSLGSAARLCSILAVLFGLIGMIPTGSRAASWAAPQALSLLSTRDVTSLQCGDEHCVGYLNSLCLEKDGMLPVARRACTSVTGTEIALFVKTAGTGMLQDVLEGENGQVSSADAYEPFQGFVAGCENMVKKTKRMNMRARQTYHCEVMQTETKSALRKSVGSV